MQPTSDIKMQSMPEMTTEAAASEQFAGICAWIVGIGGVVYSLAFLILGNSTIYSLGLMVGGLLSTIVLAALYGRVKGVDATLALWALLLGIVGAAGAFVHGGFDLANSINVPTNLPAVSAGQIDVPSQIDPRGMLTFGVAGLALLVFAWLTGKSRSFPQGFVYLTWLLAVLLVVIYLVRLIIYDPNANPIIKPALGLTGFIVNPLWYIWLGFILQRGGQRP